MLEATNEDKWGPHGSDMKGTQGLRVLWPSKTSVPSGDCEWRVRVRVIAAIARAAESSSDRALIMVRWRACLRYFSVTAACKP